MTASWQARVATFMVRRRVRPALADMRDIARVRAAFNKPLPSPSGVRYTPATLGGVAGEWVEAEPARGARAGANAGPGGADASSAPAATASATPPTTTLLYLHGGGFVGCSASTHRPLTAALALQGLRVWVPDYRLAPEHPFPAAPDDALATWHALRAQLQAEAQARGPGTTEPQRLVVAGDSAGGNLALGLVLRLRDAGQPLPDACALFSPALDLAGGSPSITGNAQRDAMFNGPQLAHLADAYLAGADATQPLASPLLADLHGLPPMLVHVGADECLRDDSLRLADKARAAGGLVQLQVFPTVNHVWQLLRWLPEARRSVRAAALFLRTATPGQPEHHDVLVIGAGLSGIGAAVHLQQRCPGKTFALLEARQAIAGTWDLFRYPGVRSDSDMYTLGYVFKPWADARAIADGPAIRRYITDTAAEHGLGTAIRLGHQVVAADWSSADARWTVTIERTAAEGAAAGTSQITSPGTPPRRLTMTCNFLLGCGGYYRYDRGHRPHFPGEESFTGTLVHPQFWPEGLNTAGQRVVVIGSGATAVTLVPELAKTAASVTMLQRSPSYVFTRPATDALALTLKRWLPAMLAYRLTRLKNVAVGLYFYRLARRYPAQAKARLVGLVRRQLPAGFDVAKHFTPHYAPWDQRVCLVPDGDLFSALREGRATVVTDTIERFTAAGITLTSGQALPADVIVTATGLELNVLADVALRLDGKPVDLAQALVYKGMMYSGVPNLASTFGYTNASWTLKADLTAGYVCRLLNHMAHHGHTVATPQRSADVQPRPFLDFTSGYVQRAITQLPQQGDRAPWRLYQNYLFDLLTLRFGRVDDGVMGFGGLRPSATHNPPQATI